MKLIDRYVAEVGKRLPLMRGRGDIENELRSTLEDMLEDRAGKAGRPAGEDLAIELLADYGSPDKVAATYNPMPYLVGPRMFPFFLMILKLVIFGVVIGMTVVTAIQAVVQMPLDPGAVLNLAGSWISRIITTCMAAFGYVVLTFAILERYVPALGFEPDETKEWDPRSLLKEPEADAVGRGELFAEILFTAAALVVLNLYPQVIGLNFNVDGTWYSTPLLSPAFFQFVPWITLAGLLEIGLDLYLLRRAAWSGWSRAGKLVLELAGLAITLLILRTPGILALTPASLTGSPLNEETARTLLGVFRTMLPSVLILILFIQGLEVVKTGYRLIRSLLPVK